MTESSSQITDLPINKTFQQGQAVQPVSQQFQMNAQREVQSHLNQGVHHPNPNNDNITIQVHETQNQYQQPLQQPQQYQSHQSQQSQQSQQPFEYKPFTNTSAQTANMQTIQQYSQPSGQGQGQEQGQALNTVEFQAMMNAIQTPGQQNTQLASRDVPQSNFQQSADIQSHPNYVPGQMKTDQVRQTTQSDLQQQNMASGSGLAETDFIEKHNESLQRKELQETKSRKMESVFEMMMEQIHVPIILAILYFMFQLPFFNERLRSQLPFLFVRENKMSVYGIVLKAVLFALSYAGINQLLEYMKV